MKNKHSNIKFTLVTALLSVLSCSTILIGSTWAYFTDTASVSTTEMQCSSATITYVEVDGTGTHITDPNQSYTFYAMANTLYEVKVAANLNTSNSCIVVRTPDGNAYTREYDSSFSICIEQEGEVNIYASWSIPTDFMEFESEAVIGSGQIELIEDEPIEPDFEAFDTPESNTPEESHESTSPEKPSPDTESDTEPESDPASTEPVFDNFNLGDVTKVIIDDYVDEEEDSPSDAYDIEAYLDDPLMRQ